MPRSSPKFGHEVVNEFFYSLWMESGEDDHTGGDEMTSYAFFRFPDGIAPEDIDEYNKKRLDVDEDMLNASEIIMLCTEMVGAILRQYTDGHVSVELYTNLPSLDRDWQRTLDDTMLEQCPECDQSSDEYGKGMPIAHLATCSQP
jgi:hypothetical protein